MKKLLLGVLLGFLLNSGLRSYHNYRWWKIESTISNEEMNKLHTKCGHFCIEEKAIDLKIMRYMLVYPYYKTNYDDQGIVIIQFP